ncbi:hypothetical protein [Hyphomicrobium sp.]|uniref:hypothetical protein n=1 Tax=Hyphomicrobium sp. TaxID=82 RepID=UPI001DA248E7|nr:hypothetical protein [Hyphomicrobium sp.]MBY0561554.1 hypothetical protein [Hyphomicrobium sp.]
MSDHPDTLSLNIYQRAVARTFMNGEYRELMKSKDWRADLEACDPLFQFLMRELASSADCDNVEEAKRRIERAIEDLEWAWKAVALIGAAKKKKVA